MPGIANICYCASLAVVVVLHVDFHENKHKATAMSTITQLLKSSLTAVIALLFSPVAVLTAQPIAIDSPLNIKSIVTLVRPQETNANNGFPIFISGAQVAAAFNKGRRREETDFGFPANALGIFSLPAGYDSFTPAQRALYIINAERQARKGMDYGRGPVSGLPLEGLETALCGVSADHAFYIDSTGNFSLTGRNGSLPFDRVSGAYQAGCLQQLGFVENLYSGPALFYNVEMAIFSWLYRDSDGGNRLLLLLQKYGYWEKAAVTVQGFVDDHGTTGSEGILGIGISNGVVVLDIADPSGQAGCGFSLVENPLPVHLISWKGSYQENVVRLDWETSWEENSDYFLVQRSADLKTFHTIAKVASAGTTRSRQHYEWTDQAPEPGNNYYRLLQTDLDGTTETSRIIAVRNESSLSGKLVVYPNPARTGEAFRVKMPEIGSGNVFLYDIIGRRLPVVTSPEREGEVLIRPGEALAAGMYSLVVVENGRRRYGQVFVQ